MEMIQQGKYLSEEVRSAIARSLIGKLAVGCPLHVRIFANEP
jgi:hypothetical protein